MKAFSFQTILKNFGKQLSSLASQMPWCNLRFNLGSISVLSRVSRPFLRTSLSTSRRASHFAAILTILFTIGVGSVSAQETVLVDIDFTSLTAQEVTQSGSYYDNRIYFDVKSGKKIIVSNSGINFNRQNGISETGGHKIGFLLKGVNKQFTVEITHDYSGQSFKFKAGYSKGVEYIESSPWSDYFSKVNTQTFSGLDGTDYVFWIGEASSSYTTIKSIRITTPTPCDGISPSLSYASTSLMVGDNSSAPTLNKDGSSGDVTSGDVTYSSSNTDVATVDENTGVVTAVGAGSATITATIAANGGKCEGTATANFTVTRDPVGEDHVITYIAQTGTGVSATLGTESKTSTSSYLTSLSDLTLNGLTISDAGKENSTPKIQTPGSEDASKYLYLTFNVASGYQFTITQISTKLVAVTDAKTVKCEISDNNGGTTQSLSYSHSKDSDPGTVHNFAFTSNNTYSGTVTVKLYVYGATSTYRLGKPLTITGDVEVKATPSCTAPTAVYVTQTAGSADMIAGESFTLSAATSTGVEEGATYQWYRNSTEVGTNSPTFTVPSCTKVDAGTYWCKITNPCSADAHTTNVTGFGIKVWQVLLYESSTWNSYDLTSTGTKTGRMSRQLAPGTYYIKLTHNNGVDFGVNIGETISEISATTPSPWMLYGSQNNIKLTVTTAGEYTFDVNYTSADYPTLSVTYPPSTISSCDKIYFCPTVNNIATGSAKFSIYFFNTTESGWANCYLVSGTEYADDAKYVAFAPSTATGWTGMIVVRYSSYISNWDNKWNQTEDITYNGYNYIVGRNEWTSDNPAKFKTHLNSFYSSTTPAMSAASYATTVGETTNASTNLTGATITYASDNTSIATINSSGVITGVAAGETTITASVGSCTVGSATVTISKNTPTQYTVSGTTSICSGDNTNITLSGSQTGASYQLKKGGVNEGEPKAGTGSSLTWSVSAAGTYTVSAVETAKYAARDMTGNAVITVKTPVSISWNTAPANGTVGGSMTASVTTNYSDGVAYSVQSATPAGCVTINNSTGAISYVAVGTATIRATVTGAGDYCSSAYVDQAVTVTAAASLTALECNTLYKVADMVPASITLSETGQYGAGLSANTKFEVLGDPSKTDQAAGTPEMKNEAAEFASQSFTARMYLKGASNTTGSGTTFVPTSRAVKFIVGESGTLDIYAHRVDRLYLKKAGDSGTTQLGNSTSGSGSKVSHNVTAGTYYIYATNSNTCIYGIQLNCCTTPAEPTAFSAGSITSTGATFSITDEGNAASYDIYYSESSTAPTEGTAATTTSDSKTKAVTGLTASTTYYAWVRSVCDADHKSIWVALSGSSFTTDAGGGCTPQSVVKTVLSSTTAGTTTGYNDKEYAGDPTIVAFQSSPVNGGYKMQSGSKLFVTLKKGNFVEGDKINIVITKASDLTNTTDKLPIFYNASSPALLTTIDAASADTYTYTLTASDITTLGSNKTIGVFRSSGDTENNPYVKSVEVEGCRDWTVDETAPTFVSSVPANGATDVATSGTIVLTFNEPLGSVDASKFTLTGATKGTVTIDGSDAAKVNITYTGAENSSTVTLATAAAAVSDVAGNALAAALSNISFTTAAAPVGGCNLYFWFNAAADATTAGVTNNEGSFFGSLPSSSANPITGSIVIDGTTYNVTQRTSNTTPSITFTVPTGKTGKLYAVVNGGSSRSVILKQGSTTIQSIVWENSCAGHDFDAVSAGTYTITSSGNMGWCMLAVKVCDALPSCTTPELDNLTNQIVCSGEDVSWTAIVNNTEDLQDGETITYQWTKNSTVLSNNATLTLNDITEAAGGTYVVTATVSAEGKASKTASKEVTLTVTPATATPTITANANTIYTGNDVTLTATCASSGVGYQWYTCNDAEGNGESEIGEAENAEYTFTAGEAGTYYYKVIVTGDGTHSCGTAEKVYTLTVTAASECEKYFWFVYAADVTSNGVINNRDNFFGSSPKTGSSNSSTYKFTLDGTEYTATRNTGDNTFSISFTVPEGSTATLALNCKGSSSKPIYLIPTSGDPVLITDNSSNAAHVVENIAAGTYKVGAKTDASASWTLAGMAVQVCTASICTDATPTITAANTTVCVGGALTITATGYETSPESIQWQKLNGSAWDNISGATAATYTVASATAADAGSYRVVVTKGCARTSNTVTIAVPSAPVFADFTSTRSVMATLALSITDVEASDATSYAWYKSADATYDAGTDTKVGTSKELLLAAGGEAAGATYYLFCVASNSCGSVTSNAITVTVTPFVEEECATAGNEGEHDFIFENTSCSSDTYGDSKTPVWKTSSRNKYLTYTAPEGKYFATAKVTVAHAGGTKCGYAYSTDGGTTWVVAELEGLSTTLTAITINFLENVNAFRISRNLTAQDGEKGSDSGNFYLAEACFTYENACTPTSVTPTTASFEYNMSVQMDFVEPTFTVKHGEEVVNDAVLTYTSSNPAIATVDEDGSVTFEGMTGIVTITAAYAGTTIDEIEYCASEGSYTITVGCQDQEPKIIAAAGTNLDGCNNSITLEAKMQDGTTAFTGGTYQWYRDGEAIEGATSASYEVVRAGTYTVSRTDACIKMSSNSAVVTNENPEPKVERLTPFQYYHVNKDYSDQMKDRHLFAVTSYGTLDGKRYHLTATRNGETLDLSSSTAFFTIPSSDNAVDTVMIDLNELKNKYAENDEIVITCAPINNCNQVSTITSSITIHVIDQTPTLALICSGANGDGTRETDKLVVGGDFLTGYNKADLCQQTGNQTFDPNTEWGFYTLLKEDYIVTPVNGYAQFNKLNYEPFDIFLLTDYPKSSKSEAAQKIIDDMAELCDYRPLLSFKTHFQSDKWKDKTTGEYKYTKWVKKGFTTAPVVPKQTATYVNIVCYAHPMFEDIDDINDQYTFHDHDDPNQLVYQVLTGPGYESSKGIQGFELADADNFVTIGLVHYNAIADSVTHDGHTHISWNAEANDRLLVAMAERQTNIEARMMLFSLNCGAQSLQTPGGRNVILKCLEYLLETDPLKVADCRFTFDNGAGNTDFDPENYEGTGVKGDSLWSTAANWGPDYIVVPGRNNDVRIAAPCIVDGVKTKVSAGDEVQETIQYYPEVLSIHITENGSLTIPANSSLTARSTILRADENGNVYPTNVADISLGSNADGNASLILNNERGDTKAGVAMYSKAEADMKNMSADNSTWQYIGTPHTDVQNATYNYYDSWLYQYDTNTQGWVVVPTGGAVEPWVGYCITHPEQGHTYWMEGTLAATTNQDITIPKGKFVVVANSWTAPIQINELTDDDMEGLTDKTIYFFNTGSDPEGDNDTIENATGDERWAAGTYIPVPIHAADYTDKDANIPSMQGFYVVGGEVDGTLHLDYERHVRAKRENVPSGPMHAPARITATDNEPQVAKFLFRGKCYDDRLIILERPDFTRGYDSGWDGEQWGGNAAAPMSYVVAETRYDAVSAIPEYEGTVIGFRAGEDNIYTIHFDYDGMEEALYLLDTETKIYTRVLKGNSYTFACPDKAEHNRFILTRKAPQIATGTENIATGENAKAVKFIKDDKIFIFVNGILYDATGKMVVR